MDAGFRRSGHVLYQPACRDCRACVPLRVPVDTFAPNSSQRRCFRKNADLVIEVDRPTATEEKLSLYNRYNSQWHGAAEVTLPEFQSAFCDSCVHTLEFSYRTPEGELLAVGLCDLAPESLSSVYFYFEPKSRSRGLGTFGALYEIGFASWNAIPYYYLGYWVAGCDAMSYKANFQPHELLSWDGKWGPPTISRRTPPGS